MNRPTFAGQVSTRRARAFAVALAGVLVVTACGGDDEAASDSAPSELPSAEAAPVTTVAPDPGDTSTSATESNVATTTGDPVTTAPLDPDLADLQERGSINIGYIDNYPWAFVDTDGELAGWGPGLVKRVVSTIGVDEVDGTITELAGLIPGLQAGRFDMIGSSLAITPERCEQVIFTDPISILTYVLVVEAGNPKGLENFESFVTGDAKLGTLSGSLETTFAEEVGIPEDNIVLFPDLVSLLEGLKAGRIDAVSTARVSAKGYLDRLDNPDDYELTATFLPVLNGKPFIAAQGLSFTPDNVALRDLFNREIAAMRESGELLEQLAPLGFGHEELDPATELTTEKLCNPA